MHTLASDSERANKADTRWSESFNLVSAGDTPSKSERS